MCHSTIGEYKYDCGDIVVNGEALDKEKFYSNDELERDRIEILQRDKHLVEELFKVMPADKKALVFCVTQEHAMRITHLIREEAKKHGIYAPHYCERVTADDGALGEQYLKEFRNSENEVPTILTTSQKLTTGVDACNVRSIVLMKQIKSMVEFKQIIGRGTRLYNGKAYFTIYDFTDATKKFTDPEWDGEVVCAKCGKNPCECSEVANKGKGNGMGGSANPCPKCGCQPCVCEKPQKNPVKVTLSGGRLIAAYWQDKVFFDNEMLSVADFLNRFAVAVRNATKSPELLCKCWADMEKRHDFIETLEVVGFNPDKLREIQRNTGNLACDILDVMLDIAYDVEPVTREFRAQKAKVKLVGLPKERESLLGVMLANYVRDGVWTLTAESFMDLLRQRYGSLVGAYSKLDFTTPRDALLFYGRIQKEIYAA